MSKQLRTSVVLVTLGLLTLAPSLFARTSVVPVKIIVEGAPSGVYAALVPPERPLSRPAAEKVGTGATVTLEVPEGEYRVVAGVRGKGVRVTEPVRVAASQKNEIRVTLPAMRTVSGTVVDEEGQPLADVRIGDVTSFVEAPLGRASELAARHFGSDWRVKSAADGSWSLPLPEGTSNSIVAEAPGYAPQWRASKEAAAEPIDLVMRRGSALRVTVDREAPEFVVTLVAKDPAVAVPAAWQAQFWGRRALKTALDWPSLPAGEYDLYAQQWDPRSFSNAVKLGTVALKSGETHELRVALPATKATPKSIASVLVRPAARFKAAAIEAFGREARGAPRSMPKVAEPVSGGTLLHLDTTGFTPPYFGTTSDRFVVLPVPDGTMAGTVAVASLKDLGGASLHLQTANESIPLPASGLATFNGCFAPETIVVPVAVSKEGRVNFPAPAGCTSFILDFEPFSPMVFPRELALGEPAWLGERMLFAAGSAAIRVATDDGAGVAGAVVSVAARTDGAAEASVAIAEKTTGPDGWARFERLPAGPELAVVARAADGDRSAVERVRTDPAQLTTIDPLRIPKPATLIVEPKLDPAFLEQFPGGHILAIFLDPIEGSAEMRTENVDSAEQIEFRRMLPGRWQLGALVSAGHGFQPVLGEQLEIKAGETRKVEARVKPLVFRGRVSGNLADLSGNIDILSSARADMVPSIEVSPSGEFVAILPRRDTYFVGVRPRSTGQMIWVGNTAFADPSQPVEIVLPQGVIVARLRADGKPLADAMVMARLQHQPTAEVPLIAVPVKTGEDGEARLEGLLPAQWVVFAIGDAHAQKSVTVTAIEPVVAELEVTTGLLVTGTVMQTFGAPVSGAKVTCLLPGPDGVPYMRVAFTGSDGSFDINDRVASRSTVLCGVTSFSGAQGYRVVAGEHARLVLPDSPATLRVTSLPALDRFSGLWLVSRDGRLIEVSPYVPRLPGDVALDIPALAPEAWKLVRVSSPAEWMALTTGGGALAAIADVTLKADERKTVNLQKAGRGNAPAGN